MIDEQKIKRAIKIQSEEWEIHYKDRTKEHATEDFLEVGRTLKDLIDLAAQYLKASEEMPQKTEVGGFGTILKDHREGYCKAIDDCTLSHLKAKEKWEAGVTTITSKGEAKRIAVQNPGLFAEIAESLGYVRTEKDELLRLRTFAENVLKQYSWDLDIDGGDIQDMAEKLGLIELRPIPEEDSIDGEKEHYFTKWTPKPHEPKEKNEKYG